jgi:hypothetical protein
MPVAQASQQLIADPKETDNPEQIYEEKTALVDDVREADLFSDFQFILF